jgi:MoxR-like ATPase
MELVERHVPLQELTAAWRSVTRQGYLALVHGEAGIGKTSLVAHFAEHFATYRDDELSPQHPLRRLLSDLATSTAARHNQRKSLWLDQPPA